MIGMKRMDNLHECLDYVRINNIEGDIIETGVWRGGAMIFAKLYFDNYYLSNKPAFMVSLVIMILGTQFFLAGFVGELITRNSPERNHYLVEETLGN
jgi:hypothetical protein